MAVGCGATCAKWTLFVFNLIFWLTGAAILGVGIWVRVDPRVIDYLHIATISSSDTLVPAAGIVLICVGAFIFITGFLGCCGAAKENGCMLMTYASILVFILILQLVAGILAAVFRNKITDMLKKSMNEVVSKKYNATDEGAISRAYDAMQMNFECCGAEKGISDWQGSVWAKDKPDFPFPPSCCVTTNKDVNNPDFKNRTACYIEGKNSSSITNGEYVYRKGCYQGLLDWLRSKAGILIGVAFGLVFVQIFVIILACWIRKSKAKEYQYV